VSDIKEISSVVPADYNDAGHWPDPQTSHDVMMKVFEHFQKHHLIVSKKLTHARTATSQSLADMKAVYKDLRLETKTKEYLDVSRFDDLWGQIIEDFSSSGISEAELQQIEQILLIIPDTIKRYYEVLVTHDRILQQLIAELDSPEYKQAIEMTQTLQARRGRMSGLKPDVYDLPAAEKSVSTTDAVSPSVIVYDNLFRKDRLQ
jgi:hypothetical protein